MSDPLRLRRSSIQEQLSRYSTINLSDAHALIDAVCVGGFVATGLLMTVRAIRLGWRVFLSTIALTVAGSILQPEWLP